MNLKKTTTIIAVAAVMAATGCTSYEIDMPANPDEPVVGEEVPTSVIYQANPRMFGTNECLNAITAQLSRISGMGCDILWVMPVYETGELNAIGSPYCVRDYKAVNPRYGTMADLQELVTTAHSLGMKVILDWVANHTAWDCDWITDHPDWYERDDAGNILSPDSWSDVAQLDYSNSELRAAMKEAITYWVDQAGVDGFRCDYAEGVPHDFWSDLISDLRDSDPDIIMLAETADTSFYDDGFDMIYDWESSSTIAAAFTGGKASNVISEATEALAEVPEGKSIMRYVFNHDVAAENDVATMFGSYDAIPAAYVLASMLNGTPMIYSSMDVEGLSGELSFFDYMTLDFSTALTDKYEAINSAFKASAEVRRGELRDYSTSSVACFVRATPQGDLLVAVNTTGDAKSVKAPISLAGETMTDLITGGETTVPVTIELESYGYTILMK